MKNYKNRSAAGLLTDFLASVSAGDPKKTASHFDPEGYLEAPYVESLGLPSRIDGRGPVEATILNLFKIATRFRFSNIKIVLESPTEVVAEYESEALLRSGRIYKQLHMCHLTARDGQILSQREFLNTLLFADAFFPNHLFSY
ncbi:hypothetical protein [Pedobacter miscanthi]|uniref:nuclear transport factor 2 family protein n=1 Tax=Pedobacter miscanthi TaxID=2259170 RepID=UPI00292CD078|nr:hypothetical protein [Pedobacter miscanthi]